MGPGDGGRGGSEPGDLPPTRKGTGQPRPRQPERPGALRRPAETPGRPGGPAAPRRSASYARLAAPAMTDAVPWAVVHTCSGATTGSSRDQPACPTSNRSTTSSRISAGTPRGPRRVAARGYTSRWRTSIPSGRARRSVRGSPRQPALRSWQPSSQRPGFPRRTAGRSWTSCCWAFGPDGHHVLSVFPGSAAFDSPLWALDIPAPSRGSPTWPG